MQEPEIGINENTDEDFQFLTYLMMQFRYVVNSYEASLQTEESNQKIAELQGKCAGHRSFMQALHEVGYPDYRDMQEKEVPIIGEDSSQPLEFEQLCSLSANIDELKGTKRYSDLTLNINKKVNEKKDWLYYQANKGRDLFFINGWHNSMELISNWMNHIKDMYEMEKQKKEKDKQEKLPFSEYVHPITKTGLLNTKMPDNDKDDDE